MGLQRGEESSTGVHTGATEAPLVPQASCEGDTISSPIATDKTEALKVPGQQLENDGLWLSGLCHQTPLDQQALHKSQHSASECSYPCGTGLCALAWMPSNLPQPCPAGCMQGLPCCPGAWWSAASWPRLHAALSGVFLCALLMPSLPWSGDAAAPASEMTELPAIPQTRR